MRLIVPLLALRPDAGGGTRVFLVSHIRYSYLNGQGAFSNIFVIPNFVISDNIPGLNYSVLFVRPND